MSASDHDLYCRELSELIARSESGNATPEDVERVEEHLRTCPACQGAESILSSAIARFRSQDAEGVSPEFEAEMLNRLCGGDRPDGSGQD